MYIPYTPLFLIHFRQSCHKFGEILKIKTLNRTKKVGTQMSEQVSKKPTVVLFAVFSMHYRKCLWNQQLRSCTYLENHVENLEIRKGLISETAEPRGPKSSCFNTFLSFFLSFKHMLKEKRQLARSSKPAAQHIYRQMYFVHLYGLHVFCALVHLDFSGFPGVRPTTGLASTMVCVYARLVWTNCEPNSWFKCASFLKKYLKNEPGWIEPGVSNFSFTLLKMMTTFWTNPCWWLPYECIQGWVEKRRWNPHQYLHTIPKHLQFWQYWLMYIWQILEMADKRIVCSHPPKVPSVILRKLVNRLGRLHWQICDICTQLYWSYSRATLNTYNILFHCMTSKVQDQNKMSLMVYIQRHDPRTMHSDYKDNGISYHPQTHIYLIYVLYAQYWTFLLVYTAYILTELG